MTPANLTRTSKHPLACPICGVPFNTPLARQWHCKDAHGVTILISEHDHRKCDAFHERSKRNG